MGISINGPSGIDTQYIIDSLVGLEQEKITRVEKQKKAYQVKIEAYSKLKTLLTDVKSKASSLGTLSSFDVFKTTSSDDKKVTITGGTGSSDAQYDVNVFQLSANEKMISKDKLIKSQNTALSTWITPGDITIDGAQIAIDSDDTIQDLRMKINNAVDEEGNKIGVTASVLKIADDNFRLVLSSKESGSEGIAYTGEALVQLGIIQDATGDKGITQQKINISNTDPAAPGLPDISSAFTSLADGEAITIAGTDHGGRAISATFIKKQDATINDFKEEISRAFNGTVDVAIDETTGALSLTDKIGGTSRLSVSSLTIGASTYGMDIETYGDEGNGVLTTGKDAWFSVEDITMNSSSNKVSEIVTGVTFDLHDVTDEKNVKVSLTRDIDEIKKKFQDLIDSYNSLVRFKKDSTKHASPSDKESVDGDLVGDSTVGSIVNQIKDAFRQQFDIEGSAYTNFTMLGLKTNTQTGEFELDADKFNKAVDTDLDSVIKLFTTSSNSSNGSIILGRTTKDTQAGRYTLKEIDSEHFDIQLEGSTEWIRSKARVGDIIIFDQGPAKGLSLTAPKDSIGAESATFTLMKGISSVIDATIAKLNDSRGGLITMRQESMEKSMDYADERILKLEDKIERYRMRLVKQFSDMEQALSQMQTQSTNMVNSLAYTYRK